jgi:DNA-binding NtrC family response regulator
MTSSETRQVRREQSSDHAALRWCGVSAASRLGPERRARANSNSDMAYILIVDSQAEFRQQLVRLLEQAGQRATAVATVSEATDILQAEVPDMLATDVVLIDGSSAGLLKQAEAAGTKTLMMTGNPDRIVEFDGAGQPFLSKPFPPDAFVQRVQEILGAG